MKYFTCFLSIISLLIALVAFLPFLGWLNWFNIPFAIIIIIFSSISNDRVGQLCCTIAILIGMFRLVIGGGII